MPKPDSQPHIMFCSGTKRPPLIPCIVIENPINISHFTPEPGFAAQACLYRNPDREASNDRFLVDALPLLHLVCSLLCL